MGIEQTARFVETVGAMPSALGETMTQFRGSDSAQKVAVAAGLTHRIAAGRPDLLPFGAGERETAYLFGVSQNLTDGHAPDAAVARAKRDVLEAGAETRRARVAAYAMDRDVQERENARFLGERMAAQGLGAPGPVEHARFDVMVPHFTAQTGDARTGRSVAFAAYRRGIDADALLAESGKSGGATANTITTALDGEKAGAIDATAPGSAPTGSGTDVIPAAFDGSGAFVPVDTTGATDGEEGTPGQSGTETDLRKKLDAEPPLSGQRPRSWKLPVAEGGDRNEASTGKAANFDHEARERVDRKARGFVTGRQSSKELEGILEELRSAAGDDEKTSAALSKLRAFVAKHRRNIDALSETFGGSEGLNEDGQRITGALDRIEAEGGDVYQRTLEVLADTTVKAERDELERQDRIKNALPGEGGVGADADESQRDFKLNETEMAVISELPFFRNIVGSVAAGKTTLEGIKAIMRGDYGEGAKTTFLGVVAGTVGGSLGRRIIRRLKAVRRKGLGGGKATPPGKEAPNSTTDFAKHPRLSTSRHRVQVDGTALPKVESKGYIGSRLWYNRQAREARNRLDRNVSLLQQAKRANVERNVFRDQTRALMKDQEFAEWLHRNYPNRSYRDLFLRYRRQGMTTEEALERIVKKAFEPNSRENIQSILLGLGIKRPPTSGT